MSDRGLAAHDEPASSAAASAARLLAENRQIPGLEHSLLERVARLDIATDEEIALLQEWAIGEFLAHCDAGWNPDARGALADDLAGTLEKLKTTWD